MIYRTIFLSEDNNERNLLIAIMILDISHCANELANGCCIVRGVAFLVLFAISYIQGTILRLSCKKCTSIVHNLYC